MKVNWNSKYNTISVYAIITFTICMLLALFVSHISVVADAVKKLVKVLAPLIWGVVIAYLIDPIRIKLESAIKTVTDRKTPHPRFNRILSTILSMVFFLAVLAAIVAIVLPQLIDSVMGIFDNFPGYMTSFEQFFDRLLINHPDIAVYINDQFDEIQKTLISYANDIVPKLGNLMLKIKDGAMGLILGLKDFIIGIIAAVYFLFDKEHFHAQIKKVSYALFPKQFAEGFFRICHQTNRSFSGFISGKIVDSIIISILCFICMTIFNFNYALLISVIIGVTNIVPFFGPIFGAIPSALLLLVSAPNQVIGFLVMVVVLQQIDGNIIGPKILGNSTGLSAFWVVFAIIISSGFFGFMGMLVGVPVFAVIYSLVDEYIEYLLKKKSMPVDTDAYFSGANESFVVTEKERIEENGA